MNNISTNSLTNIRAIFREYHFLQNKLENVLILWPGINFSINIFNPENANPIIHAERIFDILKSGQFLDDNAEFSPQKLNLLIFYFYSKINRLTL